MQLHFSTGNEFISITSETSVKNRIKNPHNVCSLSQTQERVSVLFIFDAGNYIDMALSYGDVNGSNMCNRQRMVFAVTREEERCKDPGTGLVLSGVMFNPSSSEDNWEWVELYNLS